MGKVAHYQQSLKMSWNEKFHGFHVQILEEGSSEVYIFTSCIFCLILDSDTQSKTAREVVKD